MSWCIDISYVQLVNKLWEYSIWYCFCKNISQLIFSPKFRCFYNLCFQFFLNKESFNLYMFCYIMVGWIVSNITGFFVIAIQILRAIPRFSVSVLDSNSLVSSLTCLVCEWSLLESELIPLVFKLEFRLHILSSIVASKNFDRCIVLIWTTLWNLRNNLLM